jgi:hypothetical protein
MTSVRRSKLAQSRKSAGAPSRSFRFPPDVVDADLADYFGSIPHTDLKR